MANEIVIRASLQVRNGNLNEQTQPTGFNDNQLSALGPTPGQLLIGLGHTIISFAAVGPNPGWCWIYNSDPISYVEWGVYVPSLSAFLPIGEVWPGKAQLIFLSKYLGQDQVPGTGTTPAAGTFQFAMKAVGAPATVIIKAFSR